MQCYNTWCHVSLVPSLPDLFNVAREKRGSLVSNVTYVTSQVQGCPMVICVRGPETALHLFNPRTQAVCGYSAPASLKVKNGRKTCRCLSQSGLRRGAVYTYSPLLDLLRQILLYSYWTRVAHAEVMSRENAD